ncbi:Na+/H+ antiporter NhaA [uncultured Jatrophihabitans sp.]|uniref:Na+/H+ antiporter NhaA n=1 Tax=uncultured Jatrophihabitans sp. TaxID=1610747 RepID=UPI0035CB82F0
MSEPTLRGVTQWTRGMTAPVRAYLRTESGSAGVLLAAVVAALIWSNLDAASYASAWEAKLSLRLGDVGVVRDVRTWVNSGLMTLFFFVVGLEARREFDLGDLRERRRFLLPATAGTLGMIVPVALYLVITHGGAGSSGWGIAMSTDTALALGLLAVVGRDVPDRVRIFLLTVFVVDDVIALIVVTVVYSDPIQVGPLLTALVVVGVIFAVRASGLRSGVTFAVLGVVGWFALLGSGIDPIVLGLIMGLATTDYTPSRSDLENASGLFRLFREQPTAELARSASTGLTQTLSPNARSQDLYLPWTSYVIVPLFALANAGLVLDGAFLRDAIASPITLGIVVGYVLGKPLGVVAASWFIERVSSRRLRPDVGWAAVAGSGTIAGIGFTVSFVIAARALSGRELDEAKFGVLAAGVIAAALTWVVYSITSRLPAARRARALLGDADQLVDLEAPVEPEHDHVRGPAEASVTLVEYGDLQCPFCGQAEPVVRELLDDLDLRYVWRHLPLTDVHPQAQLAAEASEAAHAQGRFWEMHDLLLTRQEHLKTADLLGYAKDLGLDTDRFLEDLMSHRFAARVARDVDSADLSGVSGTPTFFVNGQRHYGAYDIHSLKSAITIARARARIRAGAEASQPVDQPSS